MPLLKTKFLAKIGKKLRNKKIRAVRWVVLGISLILFVLFSFYNFYFLGKIFPGIYVAGANLGGKSPTEAIATIGQEVNIPQKIVLSSSDTTFEIFLNDVGLAYDFIDSARAAYGLTRTGNILYDLWTRLSLLASPKTLGVRFTLDEQKLNNNLSEIADQVATSPVYPSAKIVGKEVVIDKGKAGTQVDIPTLRISIGRALSYPTGELVQIPVKTIDPSISDEEAEGFRKRAEIFINKSLEAIFEYQDFLYKGNDLVSFLNARGGYDGEAINTLALTISSQVERQPQNPVFVFEGGRVKEFTASKDGVEVQKEELIGLITDNLKLLEENDQASASIEIPVNKTAPKITTGDVNNLGIKELIGRGISRFKGSIPNRIHNIVLASSRFKGVLVPPGETLSFNQLLGDVSELTGFKQAYVIKEGKTVLGDGGGVCQVSTTLFRAALGAGLPIVERVAHAYRVGYYEQDSVPGFDATVYSPSPDLKIKNDTPGHILIQPTVDTKTATLIFEIYGTNDGRIATTSKPIISSQTPPPEDLYVDDPTIPVGQTKQIDYKAWGARVSFNYSVTRAGEVIYKKTFVSNYRPWQAVYLRGTAPAQ
ncbi:MAG TPA: VanW family protein [Patescibacteria group bacterium]|nr:VanW family protein [Patescibacteria group bacterium]